MALATTAAHNQHHVIINSSNNIHIDSRKFKCKAHEQQGSMVLETIAYNHHHHSNSNQTTATFIIVARQHHYASLTTDQTDSWENSGQGISLNSSSMNSPSSCNKFRPNNHNSMVFNKQSPAYHIAFMDFLGMVIRFKTTAGFNQHGSTCSSTIFKTSSSKQSQQQGICSIFIFIIHVHHHELN